MRHDKTIANLRARLALMGEEPLTYREWRAKRESMGTITYHPDTYTRFGPKSPDVMRWRMDKGKFKERLRKAVRNVEVFGKPYASSVVKRRHLLTPT